MSESIEALLEEYKQLAVREVEMVKAAHDIRARMIQIRALITGEPLPPLPSLPRKETMPQRKNQERLVDAMKEAGVQEINTDWVMKRFGSNRKDSYQKIWMNCRSGNLVWVSHGRYRLARKKK